MRRNSALETIVMPVVTGLGYLWVGLQYGTYGKNSQIRLYIDKPGGVTAEDCERVSRQVSAVLSVEGSNYANYVLEVSSPGIDRLLFTIEQCVAQVGKLISARLIVPRLGKRNIKGRLEAVAEDKLSLLVEGETVLLSFADIEEARIVPEW
jgi:ribosome maturation factor RimP